MTGPGGVMQVEALLPSIRKHLTLRFLTARRDLGEVKWNKTSNGNLSYYKKLVEHFFRAPWLCFHCIVVKRAWVDVKTFHEGSYDLARRKHFTKFLSNKVSRIIAVDLRRKRDFRVYVDPIASSYQKADEAVQVIGNRMIDQCVDGGIVGAARASAIENVITVDSKERPEIQICDLLLGAVLDAWNQGSSGQAKAALKTHISGYLGWPDLRAGTYAQERKFNVWWLTDQFGSDQERVVRARNIRLRYEHPRPRRYRQKG